LCAFFENQITNVCYGTVTFIGKWNLQHEKLCLN
jgi:tetrahydromethanopterin S-methyltransferase subunit E